MKASHHENNPIQAGFLITAILFFSLLIRHAVSNSGSSVLQTGMYLGDIVNGVKIFMILFLLFVLLLHAKSKK